MFKSGDDLKIKLIIAYEGTRYSGWQVQNNAITVQKVVQDAVESVFSERYAVTGCSRTDSGVHANNYCCAISVGDSHISIPAEKLPIVFNRYLPADVSVLKAEFIDDGFHPRYDVKYKEYEYVIWNSPVRNPFLNNRAYIYPKKLDEKLMDKASKLFVGKYDFSAFMSSGGSVTDTVREIKYFNVHRDGDKVILNVAADGFLYNMVRILTGTLVEVSEGKIDIAEIPRIIAEKDRKNAGFTAPPEGLYLNKIIY